MKSSISHALLVMLMVLFNFSLPAAAKEGVIEINGVVQSMPASGLIGAWTIAGRNVRTDGATVIKQEVGAIGVGALVEVKGRDEGNGVTLATDIEVKQGAAPPPAESTTASSRARSSRCPRARWLDSGRWPDARCRS